MLPVAPPNLQLWGTCLSGVYLSLSIYIYIYMCIEYICVLFHRAHAMGRGLVRKGALMQIMLCVAFFVDSCLLGNLLEEVHLTLQALDEHLDERMTNVQRCRC